MQPSGPSRPFQGPQYDKDMFTFLPARPDRDIVVESSRKRKPTFVDHHLAPPAPNVRHGTSGFPNRKPNTSDLEDKEIQRPSQVSRSRDTSKYKGYSEKNQYRDHNDHGERRSRSARDFYEKTSESSRRLHSPVHKFSSTSYEKPSRFDRDVLAESSRKRKITSSDHRHAVPAPNVRHGISGCSKSNLNDLHGKGFQSSARALRSRESSKFKGRHEQSQYLDQNDYAERRTSTERGFYEASSEYTRHTFSNGRLQSPSCNSSPLRDRPTHFDRELLAESSRKRKVTCDHHRVLPAPNVRHGVSAFSNPKLNASDIHGKDGHSSVQVLRSREPFKGHSEQSEFWDQDDFGVRRPRNERGFCETSSEYTGYTYSSRRLQSPNHKVFSPLYPVSEDRIHEPSDLPPMTEDFHQCNNRETTSQVETCKGFNWQPLLTKDSSRCEKHEFNGHGGTHKTLDWPLPIQSSYQHEICDSNAHAAQNSINWPPSMTKENFQYENCDSKAQAVTHKLLNSPLPVTQDLSHHVNNSQSHVPRVENSPDLPEFWSYSYQMSVQPKVITSDPHENTSKSLVESQRWSHSFPRPGAVIGDLNEKVLNEEDFYKVDCTSNVKEHNDADRVVEFDSAESNKVGSSSNVNRSNIECSTGFNSNETPGNNVNASIHNIQAVTDNLLNVIRLLSAASGVSLADISGGNIQGCAHDGKMMTLHPSSAIQNPNNLSADTDLSKQHEDSSNLESVGKSAANGEIQSVKLDDESKFEASAFSEKLWNGTLQLSTSVSVSVIAFFKSGEKMQDFNWSDSVEVRGKVRLEAFEKYVQDLPRSRSRGLMVMSLFWKEGSADAGNEGMKEIAKKYKDGKRVGFVKLSTDVDMYVCPYSDAVITILAKHGYFKGMTAIKDRSEPLIGCVVWKKSLNSAPTKKISGEASTADKNRTPVGGVENTRGDKSPEFSPSPQIGQPKQSSVASSYLNSVSSTELKTQAEANNELSADFSDEDDLPEFDFTDAIPPTSVNKTSEVGAVESSAIEVQQISEAHKPTVDTQGTASKILGQHSEVMLPILPTQEQKPIEKDAASLNTKNLFDDDDIPEWCPPDLVNIAREETTKRTEVSFSLLKPNAQGSGFADLTSGFLLPPPPPPPPLTRMQFQGRNSFTQENAAAVPSQMQFKEKDYSSVPQVLPPPPPLTPMQIQRIHHLSAPQLPNFAAKGCTPETPAATTTQMSFKERDYPNAPPPPACNPAANNFMHRDPTANNVMQLSPATNNLMLQSPAANNFMPQTSVDSVHQSPFNSVHQSPAAQLRFSDQSPVTISSQILFKERGYTSESCRPPHSGDNRAVSNFTHQISAARSAQMHFEETNYSPTPRPPTPFINEPANDNGQIHSNPAVPPGFAPNPAVRPCYDQSSMKNSTRPSSWTTRQ
ncbi:unnamed protein product [Amaranthus hypochondriacus]